MARKRIQEVVDEVVVQEPQWRYFIGNLPLNRGSVARIAVTFPNVVTPLEASGFLEVDSTAYDEAFNMDPPAVTLVVTNDDSQRVLQVPTQPEGEAQDTQPVTVDHSG